MVRLIAVLLSIPFIVRFVQPAYAADIACSGIVAAAMADHTGCEDAAGELQMAFKIGSTSHPWMCARTKLGSAMVLGASLSGKQLSVYVDDLGSYSCSNLPGYSKVSYIILWNPG